MASYGQWAKTRKLTRVAWVCGPESVLQREVADAYRKLGTPEILWLDEWQQHGWNYLLTAPAQPRLAFVMNAQDMVSLDPLAYLLDDMFDGCFTVFFGHDSDFRRTGKEMVPGLAALRDSRHGQLIRCCDVREEEARTQHVADWWGCGRNLAAALLGHCDGDLGKARMAIRKAHLAGLPATEDTLKLLTDDETGRSFIDQLTALRAREAMVAASRLRSDELGEVLPLLSSRLGVLAVLGGAARAGRNVAEEGRKHKIDPYVVRIMRPYADRYDAGRVQHCREVLAIAEHNWYLGAREGLAEAVAALWCV